MVLLAAWSLVLSRLSGQDDFAVGTPIANRTREETEGLIGFFVNTLAVRVRLGVRPGDSGIDFPERAGADGSDGEKDAGVTFRDLLGRIRESSLSAWANQDLPFESLLQALAPARDRSRSPIFQVWFNFVNVPESTPRFGRLESTPLGAEAVETKFDLSLYAAEVDGAIALDFVCGRDLRPLADRRDGRAGRARSRAGRGRARREAEEISLVTGPARRPDADAPLSDARRGAVHDTWPGARRRTPAPSPPGPARSGLRRAGHDGEPIALARGARGSQGRRRRRLGAPEPAGPSERFSVF
jgi:non-ribosomal peptide synthetase component F